MRRLRSGKISHAMRLHSQERYFFIKHNLQDYSVSGDNKTIIFIFDRFRLNNRSIKVACSDCMHDINSMRCECAKTNKLYL